jgi:hypothetical protein
MPAQRHSTKIRGHLEGGGQTTILVGAEDRPKTKSALLALYSLSTRTVYELHFTRNGTTAAHDFHAIALRQIKVCACCRRAVASGPPSLQHGNITHKS